MGFAFTPLHTTKMSSEKAGGAPQPVYTIHETIDLCTSPPTTCNSLSPTSSPYRDTSGYTPETTRPEYGSGSKNDRGSYGPSVPMPVAYGNQFAPVPYPMPYSGPSLGPAFTGQPPYPVPVGTQAYIPFPQPGYIPYPVPAQPVQPFNNGPLPVPKSTKESPKPYVPFQPTVSTSTLTAPVQTPLVAAPMCTEPILAPDDRYALELPISVYGYGPTPVVKRGRSKKTVTPPPAIPETGLQEMIDKTYTLMMKKKKYRAKTLISKERTAQDSLKTVIDNLQVHHFPLTKEWGNVLPKTRDFKSLEEACCYVIKHALLNHYMLVPRYDEKSASWFLHCDRKCEDGFDKKEDDGTVRKACDFKLQIKHNSKSSMWDLMNTKECSHNHPPSVHPVAHKSANLEFYKHFAETRFEGQYYVQEEEKMRLSGSLDERTSFVAFNIDGDTYRRKDGKTPLEALHQLIQMPPLRGSFRNTVEAPESVFFAHTHGYRWWKTYPEVVVIEERPENKTGFRTLLIRGVDCDGNFFPICVCLTDSEPENGTWVWFLEQFKKMLGDYDIAHPSYIHVVGDGLKEVCTQMFPEVYANNDKLHFFVPTPTDSNSKSVQKAPDVFEMARMMLLDFVDVYESLEKKHAYNLVLTAPGYDSFYDNVLHYISYKALKLVREEAQRSVEEPCTCFKQGYPCAHKIKDMKSKGRQLFVDDFHPHWRNLFADIYWHPKVGGGWFGREWHVLKTGLDVFRPDFVEKEYIDEESERPKKKLKV